MKYELDTLPVWEAYEAEGECPLCYLARKLEAQNVDFFLGGSVMQPVIRAQINKYGFCPGHFLKLYDKGQKLSVALLAQSHFLSLGEELAREEKKLLASPKNLAQYSAALKERRGQCALCMKSRRSLERYAYTIVYLWKKKEDFNTIYTASRGFCYVHLPLILDMGAKLLRGQKLQTFLADLFERQKRNAGRMEEEIDWFIRKYDYRNKDLPWKSSRDALLRILQRITGETPG